jgi:hypothetical protein
VKDNVSTFVATEDHNSDVQSLPIATEKSKLMFEYQAARLFGMDAGGTTEPSHTS